MAASLGEEIGDVLQRGVAIPAHPLALTAQRKLDECRQRALSRYYIAAGAGGLAVGVHTTQFAIRDVGLYEPVLSIAGEEMARADAERGKPLVRVAGVIGRTKQAVGEAGKARDLGYHMGLLGLGAMKDASDDALIDHCRAVAEVIPLFGFYLHAAVGGRTLSYDFWRQFAEIENVAAIKIACFDRYQTLDVVRAIVESGREDIALYTGNDDDIVMDLLKPFGFCVEGAMCDRRIVGGLLGHWAVWTKRAVELLERCHGSAEAGGASTDLLRLSAQVTDMNAVIFDPAHGYAGCIAGIHEVLRRQGLLETIVCLDEHETLSPGQSEEITRVTAAYGHLIDDDFVARQRDEWLRG